MYKDNIFMIAYHILKSYILKAVLPSQSDKKPLLCQFISLHNNYYKILLLSTRNNLISIFGLPHGSFKKCLHSLDHVICVFHTSCLIWGMHGELSQSHVYCVDWYLCRGNVPECGTSQYIGTVHVDLIRYICPVANFLKHRC